MRPDPAFQRGKAHVGRGDLARVDENAADGRIGPTVAAGIDEPDLPAVRQDHARRTLHLDKKDFDRIGEPKQRPVLARPRIGLDLGALGIGNESPVRQSARRAQSRVESQHRFARRQSYEIVWPGKNRRAELR